MRSLVRHGPAAMLCVAVTPTSRQLAKVDLHNAARRAGLVELCLDRLAKSPDFADLFAAAGDTPLIVSCRGAGQGGAWAGTEADRLALLRQAIVAGPAYVELDLEAAAAIPRFGDVKRVVAHTLARGTLANVDDVIARAKEAHADVVKFTWPTPTLETAWPLLAAATKKGDLPVVGLGYGAAGVALSLLLRKFGSPWVYAALESGMEAFDGQPTVHELEDDYGFSSVDRPTRFVGFTGLEPAGRVGAATAEAAAVFNGALAEAGRDAKVLPIVSGDRDRLRKMCDVLNLAAIVCGPHDDVAAGLAETEGDGPTPRPDLVVRKKHEDGSARWVGRSLVGGAVVDALAAARGEALGRTQVLLLAGDDPRSRAVAADLSEAAAAVHVAGPDDVDARRVGESLGLRYVPKKAIYEARVEAIVNTSAALRIGPATAEIKPSLLRSGQTVLDVAAAEGVSTGLPEAAVDHAATLVDAAAFRAGLVRAVVAKLGGKTN